MQWQFECESETSLLCIAADEAGRGPLFGRVYAAAVILPPPDVDLQRIAFAEKIDIKDSKNFHSKEKIRRSAAFIKAHALYWSVAYEEPDVIDEINIRQANFRAVHKCIDSILSQANISSGSELKNKVIVFMDGNDFVPFVKWDEQLRVETVVKGDSKYAAIACASILAKTERDAYILDLVAQDPQLDEKYGLSSNFGYGTKKHMEGIRTYGLTEHHRKTFTKSIS